MVAPVLLLFLPFLSCQWAGVIELSLQEAGAKESKVWATCPFAYHHTIHVPLLVCRSYACSSSSCPPLPPLQLIGSVFLAASENGRKPRLRRSFTACSALTVLSSILAPGGDLVLSVCSAMEREVGDGVSSIHSDCCSYPSVVDRIFFLAYRAVVHVGPEPVSSW